MKTYDRLNQLKEQNPELIFDNDGYQYLPLETREKHKEQIKEIEQILTECGYQSVNFKNFKPRKDGSFAVRFDAMWDKTFKGVIYVSLEDFKNKE